jgi:hypothetical protein
MVVPAVKKSSGNRVKLLHFQYFAETSNERYKYLKTGGIVCRRRSLRAEFATRAHAR